MPRAVRSGASVTGVPAASQWCVLAVAGFLAVAHGWMIGCFPAGPATPYRANERLRGLTVQELLACAGPPTSEARQGRIRILTYEQSVVPSSCRAIIRIRDDRVTDVEYELLPKNGADLKGCLEVLKACLQQAR